ncbi:hypothetical protein DEO72_LG11g1683 [Vigna unguiculata]|uniref:Uncharacterized protein n=1 Tax=Vigna unguiculata TaxID=3917 RepID=A0A4D6NQ70_VIGUN|nr:hypothetical protein DEO72_LG11g1683 [Vigna unguiculata]
MLAPARESPSSSRRQPWKPSNQQLRLLRHGNAHGSGKHETTVLNTFNGRATVETQPPSLPSEFTPISTTTELRRVVFSMHPAATTMTTPRSRVCISPKQPQITSSPCISAHQHLQPRPFVRHHDNSGTRTHLHFSATAVESAPSAFLPPPRQPRNFRSTTHDSQTLMGKLP